MLINKIKATNDNFILIEEPLEDHMEILSDVDFLVSYGYRHVIRPKVLELFPNRAINLHIALLPWNKGADPNLWSFLENTPKGVTIHYIDEGLDTGYVISQKEMSFELHETLRTCYNKLSFEIEEMFGMVWAKIRSGEVHSYPQLAGGSYHRMIEKHKYEHLLTMGWDTPIIELIGKGL
ncbi:methionyl-tRNA formyltransferase [Paenibacillus sp. 1_12]|nr:methionyl-tRNA formyltransferase [Paenibacillus sp. 1_12]